MEQDRHNPRKAGSKSFAGTSRASEGAATTAPGSNVRGKTYDEDEMAEGMSAASSTGAASARAAGSQAGGMASSAPSGRERIRTGPGSGPSEGPGPQIMAADTLEGDDVVNDAGENLGEIKHIMLDVPSGRVAYAVLSFGGFLGMGDKLFAIPWEALELDTENKCFVLNVDKEHLRQAPGFDKDHWPSMADQTWAVEIHRYYGTQAVLGMTGCRLRKGHHRCPFLMQGVLVSVKVARFAAHARIGDVLIEHRSQPIDRWRILNPAQQVFRRVGQNGRDVARSRSRRRKDGRRFRGERIAGQQSNRCGAQPRAQVLVGALRGERAAIEAGGACCGQLSACGA